MRQASGALIFLSLCTPTPVLADRLSLLAVDSEEMRVVDVADVISSLPGTKKLWEITIYGVSPRPTRNGRITKRVAVQYEVQCSSKQTRRLYAVTFDSADKVIDSGNLREGWVPVAPGTQLVDLHRFACVGVKDTDLVFENLDEANEVYASCRADPSNK